ncbi:SpoIIE family protein phosphatase [Tumidithrix elongata RA019]|uniref:SpoIIE family protein phosphatase n=1 Tax=Tumidithrix elongata BACA0141 TaxID=2716417 RepID=A0AAW9PYH0_9CYAN|nr:SpoIIE family protein phosphatase [Tumidithrix elongata RA019]
MQPNSASNDLTNGRLLQRSLLPQTLPVYLGLDIAAEVWTAVDLGGDYYQFLEQPGTLAVAIADSSGKSVAGAIHAALFKGQLDAYAQQGRLQNPVSMLSSLNQLLCKSRTEDAVALCYGALDLGTYEVHLGNAGIPGPIIYRAATNKCEEVVNPAIALGRYEDTQFKATKRSLEEGDIVVFCSDGLFEAVSPDGDEYGSAGLDGISPFKKSLISLAHLPAKEILSGLKVELDRFSERDEPEDDVSIVVIKLDRKVQLQELRDCPYQEALQAWARSEEQDVSALLRGSRLAAALAWAELQPTLGKLDQDFLEASKRVNEKEQLIAARAADADRLEKLSHDLEISLETERQQRIIAEMGEINERIVAMTISSEALYLSNNHIEALIAGVIGGVQLKRLVTQVSAENLANLKANTLIRSITALEQVVYGIHEYNRLEGHGFWVNRVCYSPNGKLIASVSSDRSIKIWGSNGNLIQTLLGHSNWVTSVAFSPSGKMIATASRDNMVKLWQIDEKTGLFYEQPTQTLKGHEGPVLDVCFSPDGEIVASASEDTTVRLWKTNGVLLRTFRGGHERWVTCVAFHPNGKNLISGSADRLLIIWNLQGVIQRRLKGHDSFVESVCFDPRGQAIASASRDKTVKLWGTDGVLLKTFYGHTDKVWGVCFSPDGKTLASAAWDRTIRVWDIEHGLIKTFSGHGDVVQSVAFSPDGKSIASASRDTTVKLWNIRGTPIRRLLGHAEEVSSVAISPDTKLMASGCKDKTINLWNANGTLAAKLEGHNDRVHCVTFSPNSETLLSASGDASIRFWRKDGSLIDTLSAHRAAVYCVAYRCDGQVFASCSADSTVRIWTAEGTWLQTLSGHSSEVYSVCFSPDGSMLASVSKDKIVNIWSWDGVLLRTLDGHSAEVYTVCFSPDGLLLATGSMDQSVKIWSIDGTLLKTLNGHSAEVTSVCFSPDGKALASASEDSLVQFWSVDGTLLRTFNGHRGPVRTVSFSPNGRILVSAGEDGGIVMWNLDLENLLMRGCQWLQEYLRTSANVSEEDKRSCLGGCGWLYKYLKAGTK